MCAYTVGPKVDYERWADLAGDSSFGWENVTRIRKDKLEAFDETISQEHDMYAAPDMSVHGEHGALQLSIPRVWEDPVTLQLEAARASNLGLNLDINSGNPLGMASVPSTAKAGLRSTATKAYLENAPHNLTIMTETTVARVILDGTKAIGVRTANGDEYRASREVILSAGAVSTPKLLMLSGIGDTNELAKHNIETLHHLPGVGKNLQDHLSAPFCWKQKKGAVDWPKHFSNPDTIAKAREQFMKDGTGPLSVFFQGLVMGFFKADEVLDSEEFDGLDQDVKDHLRNETIPVWELSSHIPPCTPNALSAPENHYLTMFIFLHNPQSRGTVRLASADPNAPPLIDPNFFSHPFDTLCALAATKRALAFTRYPSIAADIDYQADGPESESDEHILQYWRKAASSTWHPSCTASMGREEDETTCVLSDFKVKGLQGLRVVDLSVLPFLLSCHPVSIAYLVGEIAAEKIIGGFELDK
ncbi:unnamed protein product [Cercospora beticola]|nr:unnamed protein product [Cercospora beticola]